MLELAELAPCGILEFNEEGQIIRANPEAQKLLGFSIEELLRLKVDAIFTMSSRIFYQTHFLPLLKLCEKADEIFLTLKGKTEYSIPVLMNAVRISCGPAFHIVCAFILVKQRRKYEDEILEGKKRAEEALRNNKELQKLQLELEQRLQELDRHVVELDRKNRELVRLNEILSHDLKEPVRKISVFTDLLFQDNREVLNENGTMAVSRIRAACARLYDIMRVLQQFLTADEKGELVPMIDLNEIVQTVRSQLVRENPELEVSCEKLLSVDGYPAQLQTLFEILMRNSLRLRAEEPPKVRIWSTRVQHNSFEKIAGKYRYIDFAQITISDNSRGFGCTECSALFELLSKRRTDEILDSELATCRRIVENHHGSISLYSPTSEGASFTILLPMKQEARRKPEHMPTEVERVL